MNIWILEIGEPLPIHKGVRKMRMAIIADKLMEKGHTVRWWISAFEHQRKIMQFQKDQEVMLPSGLILQVLRGCGYRKNVSVKRYIDHLIIAWKFKRQSETLTPPDVVVASMPCYHIAYEAARYVKKNRIPILVDIQDLWPDIFLNPFKNSVFFQIGKAILAYDFYKLKFLLNQADSLIAVSNGYLKWGLNKIGRAQSKSDRVFYLGYQSNGYRLENIKSSPAWLKGRENCKIFTFIGTFGISYELELIVNIAHTFCKEGKKDILFVLAGTGEKEMMIKKKASNLPNVVLPGWINKEEINSLMQVSYAGLVPCRSVENTMPNKPFEYLSAGLPLINSLEGEMAELIDEHQLGLNYKPGDVDGLCRCISRLADDTALREKMSQHAIEFFRKYGDADKIYEDYANHIESLAIDGYQNRETCHEH